MSKSLPSKAELQATVQKWRHHSRVRPSGLAIETPGPGQESVWDFPRPPALQTVDLPIKVVFAGAVIAETRHALRVIETAGAPCYYIPPDDVDQDRLEPTPGFSVCEWKGAAVYFDVTANGRTARKAAWTYPDPLTDLDDDYARLAYHVAFYPAPMDSCTIGDETVTPQPGGFYGGWVTQSLTGPIKGVPGSEGW